MQSLVTWMVKIDNSAYMRATTRIAGNLLGMLVVLRGQTKPNPSNDDRHALLYKVSLSITRKRLHV